MKKIMCMLILFTTVFLMSVSSSYAFELNGFADVSFTASVDAPEGSLGEESKNGNFAFGTLDLYLAQSLEDIDILVELVVEEGAILDLERLTIGYTFEDSLKVRFGRFHTPIGVWNTAYHHGTQLQPTIARPEFLNFEDDGGILPVHTIGLYLSGRVRTEAGAIEYGAMYGNGPAVTGEDGNIILTPNNIGDNNTNKAVAAHASIAPEAVKGLKIGVSGYLSNVQTDENAMIDSDIDSDIDDPIDPVDVDQTIIGAAISYSIADVGLMGEYFSIANKDNIADDSFTSSAYYALLTYSIKDKWIPYVMYENMTADDEDPYFLTLGTSDITRVSGGLRYNINYRSSIKGEIRSNDQEDIVKDDTWTWTEYAVQWALAF
ncbi:MAG: hypothetical protein A2Y48_02040 [Nitrospirae bacterium RIFCSPLOW2_12_42_9]|nr:MAG: hypothetical protein A2Z60_00615 [Nitrospirae bacterium RIFCSPLOWO2_02_42_7]OGW56426.1 MAG: hypothetical protein A3D21_07140 [Nitrospirae bacterium RIFCSPHIGHO2_02_FULL_42_12]OGW61444.1 MAG: hypothetical protein A2Y48_02040 [Nitrospirae bacterium RIFCSPLOW2_12_42_9]